MDYKKSKHMEERALKAKQIKNQEKMEKVVIAAGAVGAMGLMKLIFMYPYRFLKWFFKFIFINPWGNVGIGGLGAFTVLGQFFGLIDLSAEPSARQIELDGRFDWTMMGFCLVILTVGIFRLVRRK